MEINSNSVSGMAKFFYLIGYGKIAEELENAYNNYSQCTRQLLQTDFYGQKDVKDLDGIIADRMAAYKQSLNELVEIFEQSVKKTAVMTDNAKWRRCGI